jgi:hypothetical protein
MRRLPVSLALLAAVTVAVLAPGSACAQGYYRANRYAPSNFGMMNTSTWTMGGFGMSRPSFAMPNLNPYGVNAGTLTAGSPVPLGAVPLLPGIPIAGNTLPGTAAFPAPTTFGTLPAAPLPGSGYLAPPAVFGNPGEAEAAAPPTPGGAEMPATGGYVGTLPGTPFTGTPIAGSSVAPLIPATAPSLVGSRPSYVGPYSAPQYQSSFFDPLRRVYGPSRD